MDMDNITHIISADDARRFAHMHAETHDGIAERAMTLVDTRHDDAAADVVYVFACVRRGGRGVDAWNVIEVAEFVDTEYIVTSFAARNIDGGEREYDDRWRKSDA